jgi:hypothetical protein
VNSNRWSLVGCTFVAGSVRDPYQLAEHVPLTMSVDGAAVAAQCMNYSHEL